MSLVEKTTHEAEAVATFLQQFKGKAKLAALLASYVDQVQQLEAVLFDVLASRAIDAAEGDQLDLLGDLVGQDREGRSDSDYRIWIKARIRVNLSSGTGNDIIATVGAILGTAGRVTITELPPAAMRVDVSNALGGTPADVAELISQARGAGIDCNLVYTLAADAATFTFSSGDTEEASAAQGWADDAQTSGGVFADALEA
jgi:hypothetical protein